jgi:hypothetical protein
MNSKFRIEKTCKTCSKKFTVKRCYVYPANFCSRDCQKNYPNEKRFWDKVKIGKKSDCWPWIGTVANNPKFPYGNFKMAGGKGHHKQAHRYSYELHNGRIQLGMIICHKCDNPRCVNPDHLFVGTYKDNGADMASKNRSAFGEKCSKAKLKERDIILIFRMIKVRPDIQQRELAQIFNVSQPTIGNVLKRETWRRVTE